MLMDLLELIKVIIQGIVEGITEWLPISSTGHMLLLDEFMPMNMTQEFKDMFFVVIQFGAIFAVILIFGISCGRLEFKTQTFYRQDSDG